MHFAVLFEGLQEPQTARPAVHSYRNQRAELATGAEPVPEAGEDSIQMVHHLAHCLPRHGYQLLAASDVPHQRRDPDLGHSYSMTPIAFKIFGAVIGSSRIRTPVARYMAFAIAAGGPTIGVSPMPRTP